MKYGSVENECAGAGGVSRRIYLPRVIPSKSSPSLQVSVFHVMPCSTGIDVFKCFVSHSYFFHARSYSIDPSESCFSEPPVIDHMSYHTWLGTLRLLFLCAVVQVALATVAALWDMLRKVARGNSSEVFDMDEKYTWYKVAFDCILVLMSAARYANTTQEIVCIFMGDRPDDAQYCCLCQTPCH